MSLVTPVRESTEIVTFEALYLDWFRNITVLYVAAVALMPFSHLTFLSFCVFIISLFLLIVIQVDYLIERERLVNKGFDIPSRLDWLWVGITALFIVGIVITWNLYSS